MADWEAGDLVMCRTALGDEVIGTAVSGIVMGRDMQVVWIDFGDRHCLPWPVEAVRAGEHERPSAGPVTEVASSEPLPLTGEAPGPADEAKFCGYCGHQAHPDGGCRGCLLVNGKCR